jgi:O-antigen ligase
VNVARRQYLSSVVAARWTKLWTFPFVCLLLFTFIVVSERGLFAWVFICLSLAGVVARSQGIRFPALLGWAAAFAAWSLLTAITALSPSIASEDVVEHIKSILILFAVVNLLRTEAQLRMFLLVILGAFLIYPVRGGLKNYAQGYTDGGRLLWNHMYINPNYMAGVALLVIGIALSFATAKEERLWVRRGCVASVIVLLVVVLLTQSRGAFIGLMIGMGIPGAILLMRRPSARILYVVLALLIGVALIPHSVWHRLEGIEKLTSTATIAEADPQHSAAQRWEIQKTAWRVFIGHPLLGVGLGCYPLANAIYSPELGERDAHNSYLGLAAETGAPGLILWFALVISVLRYAARARREKAAVPLSLNVIWIQRALIAFLVAGTFSTYGHLTHLYLALGALWCASTISRGTDKPAPVRPILMQRTLAQRHP